MTLKNKWRVIGFGVGLAIISTLEESFFNEVMIAACYQFAFAQIGAWAQGLTDGTER